MLLDASHFTFTNDGNNVIITGFTSAARATFSDSTTIQDITIPSTIVYEDVSYNVTEIAENAFKSKSEFDIHPQLFLGTVTLSEGITTIGLNAFYGNRIENVIIPSTVTHIGQGAFIKNNIKTVTMNCNYSPNITPEFILDENLVCIIVLNPTVTGWSFAFTQGVIPIGIPSDDGNYLFLLNGTEILITGFIYTSTLIPTLTNSNVPGNWTIPSTLFHQDVSYNITGIDYNAFNGGWAKHYVYSEGHYIYDSNQKPVQHYLNIDTLTISEGIETINFGAFSNNYNSTQSNSGIKHIVFPSTVKTIGNKTFEYNQLETVTMNCNYDSKTDIEDGFSEGNPKCIIINITPSVTGWPSSIGSNHLPVGIPSDEGEYFFVIDGSNAVISCITSSKLSTLTTGIPVDWTIPSILYYEDVSYNVSSIGDYVFSNKNVNISTLTLSEGIETIGAYSFSPSNTIRNCVLPESLISIGDGAFQNDHIQTITMNCSYSENFNNRCLNGNANVVIYTTPTVTGWGSTFGDYNIPIYHISDDGHFLLLTNGNNAVIYGLTSSKLSTLTTGTPVDWTIPSILSYQDVSYNVTEIAANAFNDKGLNINMLTLSEGITTIGSDSFSQNSIDNVIIPSTVTHIGDEAFYNSNIQTITANCNLSEYFSPTCFNHNYFNDYRGCVIFITPSQTGWNYLFGSENSVIVGIPSDDGNFLFLTNGTLSGLSPTAVANYQDSNVIQNLIVPSKLYYNNTRYNITNMPNYLFSNRYLYIRNLIIEEGIENIGFQLCVTDHIDTVIIPRSVISTGGSAFAECHLQSVRINCNYNTNLSPDTFAIANPQGAIYLDPSSTGWSTTFGTNHIPVVHLTSPTLTITDIATNRVVSFPENVVPGKDYRISYVNNNPDSNSTYYILLYSGIYNGADLSGAKMNGRRDIVYSNGGTSMNITFDHKIELYTPYSFGTIFDPAASLSMLYVFQQTSNNNNVVVASQPVIYNLYNISETTLLGFNSIPECIPTLSPPTTIDISSLSITTIGANAFENQSLTSVILPSSSSFTTIGSSAFAGNDLSSITIPASVTTIGNNAFSNNSILRSTTFLGNAPTLGTGLFSGTKVSRLMIQKNATGWANNSLSLPISVVCFPAGTPIQTDQGIIPIEQVDASLHTIRKKSIVAVTQTVSPDKYLIQIKAESLGPRIPSNTTVMSKTHCILFQGKMVPAAHLFEQGIEGVSRVVYNGEKLYNVLLEKYEKMMVNHLVVETLHPENNVAQLYRRVLLNDAYSEEEKEAFVKRMNRAYFKYNKLV